MQRFYIYLIGYRGTKTTATMAFAAWMMRHNVPLVGAFLDAAGPMAGGKLQDSLILEGHCLGPVAKVQVQSLARALETALQCVSTVDDDMLTS
jgi:hypothetical protein